LTYQPYAAFVGIRRLAASFFSFSSEKGDSILRVRQDGGQRGRFFVETRISMFDVGLFGENGIAKIAERGNIQ
jgi:hypothetical protein